MCLSHKPHTFGNEYHSIADGDDKKPMMWCILIQEGKDCAKLNSGRWAFPSKYENETMTGLLMLFMTEPIHNTVVCMGSGFCVATGIIALHKRVVYGHEKSIGQSMCKAPLWNLSSWQQVRGCKILCADYRGQ
ncbi:LOW QUALITY PROTEIN: hypothetical protein ACHAW6_002401 [Cyclotella cf. meneghiniana]